MVWVRSQIASLFKRFGWSGHACRVLMMAENDKNAFAYPSIAEGCFLKLSFLFCKIPTWALYVVTVGKKAVFWALCCGIRSLVQQDMRNWNICNSKIA